MSDSFKNEIPKARVNITLELETQGEIKKTELPMKLLILGKFSENGEEADIVSREKININKENFNQVTDKIAPVVDINVKNHVTEESEKLHVNLQFKSRKDFRPESIVRQVPELRYLLAVRNLLRELKANVINDKHLRGQLEYIIKDKANMVTFKAELMRLEKLSEESVRSESARQVK